MIDPDPMQSREAYDAYVETWPKDQRWQWWPVPWKLASAAERIVIIAVWTAGALIVAIGTLALIVAIDFSMEGIARTAEQHDVCLRLATNGHEMVECDR